MTNYKNNWMSFTVMGLTYTLALGANIQNTIGPGTQIIPLFYKHSLSTAPKSMLDMRDGSVYIVPTNKKILLYGAILYTNAAAGNLTTIYQGDTEDAITSSKAVIANQINIGVTEVLIRATITALKYVTSDPQSQVYNIAVYGIEVDA